MNDSKPGYLYIALTILLTVYGQLILKWRMTHYGALPADWAEKGRFFWGVLKDPFVISSFIAAFLASLTWMAAVTKFELSYAYPFMSLAFVLVLICSVPFFNETLNLAKVGGLLLIMIGIVIASRG